ncbi:hypothetical protein Tcan_11324 [Toxocara canis]|uniref:DUF148 domain-containing protein n=2 Tax=Toxocara canis TaxID=6265 RepID=A0A0B2VWS2_TOXCA|nr:hypothetical protein Tcan_11324 [Toxocara canis]
MNAFIIAAFVVVVASASNSNEQLVPVYLEEAPDSVKKDFAKLISEPGLTPAELRSAINLFVLKQSKKIQEAYKQFEEQIESIKRSKPVPQITPLEVEQIGPKIKASWGYQSFFRNYVCPQPFPVALNYGHRNAYGLHSIRTAQNDF